MVMVRGKDGKVDVLYNLQAGREAVDPTQRWGTNCSCTSPSTAKMCASCTV
jgi:hypothetical protein